MQRWKKELTVRERMGVSQDLFAAYLGVTRGLYSMYEADIRELPHEAHMKNIALVILLQKETAPTQNYVDAEQEVDEKIARLLARRLRVIEVKLLKAQMEMETMKTRQQQCLTAMLAVSHLLPNIPAGEEGKGDRLALELIEALAKQKLRSCGAKAQALLQLKIDLMQFEINRLVEMMK